MPTFSLTDYLVFGVSASIFSILIGLLVWWCLNEISPRERQDREFLDPPPLSFRLIWWLVLYLQVKVESWMSAKTKHALMLKLTQAGVEYRLTPQQFQSGRISFVAIAVVFLVTSAALCGLSEDNSLSQLIQMMGLTNSVVIVTIALLLIWYLPMIWLDDLVKKRKKEFIRSLPFFLDVITLCVEAGLNLQGAITQAVEKGPRGYLRDEFQRILRDMRAGKRKADALLAMNGRVNESSLSSFTSSVIQAEKMGMNLGPMLRAQSDQRLADRFMRAEKLAMEAPVKMLFPLIACIFPCTFIVLLFPIASKLLSIGN